MIKVGYLVSYDYSMFLISVKQLYNYVNKIYVAIDIERKTWSGNMFEIPDSFFNEVKQFDTKNKIEFYFDNFFVADLLPMQCETRERNLLLKKMGKGWLMQLDVDEYIYDFKSISQYLKNHWYLIVFPKVTPILFRGKLVTLFRQLTGGYLYIENNERFSFITNQSNYTLTRNNDKVRNHYTNINVIHQSWARSEDEIQMKIKNWGHRDDFETQKFFEFWKSLNSINYKKYKNFHPLSQNIWNELKFLPSSSIEEFIQEYSAVNSQKLISVSKKKIFKTIIKKFLGKE
jgi:hypothetical protein